MSKIKFQGEEYELSSKLKVAFLIQKAFNHKPYTEVFREVGTLGIDRQIEIIWLAFREENPEVAIGLSLTKFQEGLFEESNVTYIYEALTGVIEGIMYHGMSEEEIEEKKMEGQGELTSRGRKYSDEVIE